MAFTKAVELSMPLKFQSKQVTAGNTSSFKLPTRGSLGFHPTVEIAGGVSRRPRTARLGRFTSCPGLGRYGRRKGNDGAPFAGSLGVRTVGFPGNWIAS